MQERVNPLVAAWAAQSATVAEQAEAVAQAERAVAQAEAEEQAAARAEEAALLQLQHNIASRTYNYITNTAGTISQELPFGAIKSLLIASHIGKLFISDYLVGDGIKVDLNQGHPHRLEPAAILATLERKR